MAILEIAIVGIIASLLMKAIKKQFVTNELGTKLATVGVSIILGGLYYFLRDTSLWPSVIGVLTMASTFYAFFLKK